MRSQTSPSWSATAGSCSRKQTGCRTADAFGGFMTGTIEKEKMSLPRPPKRPASYDKRVALVLQGGGALGSYQAGVYEALSDSEYMPDWIAGISVGAIN